MSVATPTEQAQILLANTVDALPKGLLESQLKKAATEGRQLRVKLGIDPSTADIHLGHCVVLKKLREFQDLGHHAVLIIGDYTARVGDPSLKSKTRPMITEDEIMHNAQTYQDQAFRILDPDKTEVRWNGEWLGTMPPSELFSIMSRATVAQLLQRDDFSKRFAADTPISLLEMIYPLLQGYDSVAIRADIELGGTDQLYNVLMGREIQPHYGQQPQSILTLPILTGTDGVQKMSKSLGNYIAVDEQPAEMFGKTMSIPDEAMPEWFRLATGMSPEQADAAVRELEQGAHPGVLKRRLAKAIITRFHGDEAADAAEARFDAVFKSNAVPDDAPTVELSAADLNDAGAIFLPAFLVRHLGVASNGEARRLISGGGVKVDGEKVDISTLELDPASLKGKVVQVSKRKFVRVHE